MLSAVRNRSAASLKIVGSPEPDAQGILRGKSSKPEIFYDTEQADTVSAQISLSLFPHKERKPNAMMPNSLMSFIRCLWNKQSSVNARWTAAYDGGSPAALASIRRAKLDAIYKTLHKNNRAIRTFWERLIKAVGFDSPLISIQPAMVCQPAEEGNTFLDALLWCAMRYGDWIRPIETWHAETDEPHALFSSLIHHLFLNYSLPPFLLSAWFEGFNETAWEHQNWAIHLGRGGSLQTLSLPLALTHRAAHRFLQTPTKFTIAQGLRMAQVTAMGGSEELAKLLSHTLHLPEPDEEFLLPLLGLWVRQPVTEYRTVQTIVEYARFQKLQLEQEGGTFSFAGRTTAALSREAQEWDARRNTGTLATQWKRQELPAVVREVEYVEGQRATWTVDELVTSRELYAEGRGMRNCVYSYLERCVEGKASIWSVRFQRTDSGKMRRVLTVEIAPESREIIQVGGFANGALKPQNKQQTFAFALLKEWAESHELKLNCGLE